MAEEHNAIKYGTVISRAASIAAGGAYGDVGISRLSETLVAPLNLWDWKNTPEFALLRSQILFARTVTQAGVAGRFSSCELVNPSTSTKIAVVHRIECIATQIVELVVDSGPALGINATNRGLATDTRFNSLGEVSQCTVVSGDLAAAAVLPQWTIHPTARPMATTPPPFIIVPGKKLFAIVNTVALSLTTSIFWSERTPFPGELQARG